MLFTLFLGLMADAHKTIYADHRTEHHDAKHRSHMRSHKYRSRSDHGSTNKATHDLNRNALAGGCNRVCALYTPAQICAR